MPDVPSEKPISDFTRQQFIILFSACFDLIQEGLKSEQEIQLLVKSLRIFVAHNDYHYNKVRGLAGKKTFIERLSQYGELMWYAVFSCGLSVRGRNLLLTLSHHKSAAPFQYLLKKTPRQLMRFNNVGSVTVTEINNALAQFELRLGMSDEEIREIFG